MKTFFIALVLGIFIGAALTAYFKKPAAFDDLISDTRNTIGIGSDAEPELDEVSETLAEPILPTTPPSSTPEEHVATETEPSLSATDTQAQPEESQTVAATENDGAPDDGDSQEVSSDSTLEAQVYEKLEAALQIDASAITVREEQGKVILSGAVSSVEVEQQVLQLVREMDSVDEVISQLEVTNEPSEAEF